jgi:hypothetical protein
MLKKAVTGDENMDTTCNRAADCSTVFLRLALGFSFLSAVADRFGLWGAYGQPHVAWGDFARFVATESIRLAPMRFIIHRYDGNSASS